MDKSKQIFVGPVTFGSGKPNVCVPITGKNKEEIIDQTKKIKDAMPDLVEWRGDFYENVTDVSSTLELAKEIKEILGEIPLLFTFRTKNEGGNRAIAIEDYKALNLKLSESDAIQLIDVEVHMDFEQMKQLIEKLHKKNKVVIGSHHRFDKTPSNEYMTDILTAIEAAGADILKLAVMPQEASDVERLIETTKEVSENIVNHPVVTMSMGALGVKTRICGEVFGSAMTFACVGEASAPGQMEINELRKKMEELSID